MPLDQNELEQITGAVQTRMNEVRAEDAARITELEKQLAEATEARKAAEARSNRPGIYGGMGGQPSSPDVRARHASQTPQQRKDHIVRVIGHTARGLAIARKEGGGLRLAEEIIRDEFGDPETASALRRSLSEGVATDGGNLIEPVYAQDMIDLLYTQASVRNMPGVRVLPMPNGQMTFHVQTGGVTGRYEAELNNLVVQQPTTGLLSMSAKKLAVIVPVSDELLHDSSGRVDNLIVSDIRKGLTLREDLAFLRGDGTNNTPTGILNQVDPANKKQYSGFEKLALGLRTQVAKAQIPMESLGWIFNTDFLMALMALRSPQGLSYYGDQLNAGNWFGFPFRIDDQIPSNLVTTGPAGTNGTEVYFGNWSEVMIGETLALNLDSSTEGSYFNGSTLVNAWSTDQTLYRARTRHDILLRYKKAIAVGTIDLTTVTTI